LVVFHRYRSGEITLAVFFDCDTLPLMNESAEELIMKAKPWLLSCLVGFISLLSGCGGAAMSNEKEMTIFEWYAVATAPRDYPMEVINGTFYYKGQDAGLWIPSGGTIHQG